MSLMGHRIMWTEITNALENSNVIHTFARADYNFLPAFHRFGAFQLNLVNLIFLLYFQLIPYKIDLIA